MGVMYFMYFMYVMYFMYLMYFIIIIIINVGRELWEELANELARDRVSRYAALSARHRIPEG